MKTVMMKYRNLYFAAMLLVIVSCTLQKGKNEADQEKVQLTETDHVKDENIKAKDIVQLNEVVEWCMALDPLSRPQSVFALQKELSREGERRYTKLSVTEKVRMQFDTMVADTKKSVGVVGNVAGAKPK